MAVYRGNVVNSTQGNRRAVPFTLPLNVILFLIVVTMYRQTIRILKAHKRENHSLSSTTKNIVKLSTVYMYLYLLIQGYLLVYQMLLAHIHSYFGIQGKNFLSVFYGTIPSISGAINGLAFLMINHQSKHLVCRTLAFTFRIPRRTNRIDLPRIPRNQ